MNLTDSIKDWIEYNNDGTSIASFSIFIPGGIEDSGPPCIRLSEESATQVEQNGVIMRGVYQYELTAAIVSVPGDTEETATNAADYAQQRKDLHQILADKSAIGFINNRNRWQVFDIQTGAPTMDAEDGTRVATVNMTVIACPLQ